MADLTSATAGLLEVAREPLKDSIAGLGAVSGNLATGSADLEQFLTVLPDKFEAVGQAGTYGSWINFYLCESLLTSDPPQHYVNQNPRCRG
jgi:phospholipid/cholesterol/gamma-HCH transport system substrate-binding protein